MRSDNLRQAPPNGLIPPSLSPQDKAIAFKNPEGELSSAFKVDSAVVRGRRITLCGWATPNCDMQIWLGDHKLPSVISRHLRPDITRRLNTDGPASDLGFTITARNAVITTRAIDLHVRIARMGREHPIEHVYAITLTDDKVRPASVAKPGALAVGVLQQAKFSSVTGDLLVVGWLVASDEADVWLENEEGEEFSLDGAYRTFIADVAKVHAAQFGSRCASKAGLILRLTGIPFSKSLRLMMSDGETLRLLSECQVSRMAVDPVEAARWLFGLPASNRTLHQRFSQIDLPLLNSLIDQDRRHWSDLPVERRVLGSGPAAPTVSLIIPLYGRADFVEHHFIAFQQDPWFQQHVEVIYVIDDMRLLEAFATQAEQWHRLYQQPFQWVWGAANRGYSGANNLGAQYASADILLFMNSDVIPIQPGWVQAMVEALTKNPAMGAVTPRLLFPDGSLQHAGMQFVRKEDWGIWINHHPLSGCPPDADPHTTLTSVPAVTGACMAIPRTIFDQAGGWDTGYLIGDFEDSDMCLRLRAAGFEIGYLPTVSMTHLERQSFPFAGQGEFRQRVTLWNAVRHQQRWATALASSKAAGETATGMQG